MSLTEQQLKREILTALEKAEQPQHRTNLIGREHQQGTIESARKLRFSSSERALAYKTFDELKRESLIRATYNDISDPENWVVITDLGRTYLLSDVPPNPLNKGGRAPRITLDTNCIINLFDVSASTPTSLDELLELMRLGLSHELDIAITTRVEDDLLQDKNPQRKAEMMRMLNLFPVVSSGRPDKGSGDLEKEIQRVVFPGLQETDRRFTNKQRDVKHLTTHLINGRDLFVTDDTALLKKDPDLRTQFGIKVATPSKCIAFSENIKRLQTSAFKPRQSDANYTSPGFRGRVSFDYSNNDGTFTIGTGLAGFDTKWSKSSDNSIHAYSDGENVDAIALVKNVHTISEVSDAASLNYSSRSRTPSIGQVVIWRNKNGLYAATQIIRIEDDSRGAEADDVVFDYVINADGSANFGQ